jgi:hypothetical protein
MLMNIATKVIVDMREFRWDNHICLVTKSGQTSVGDPDPALLVRGPDPHQNVTHPQHWS